MSWMHLQTEPDTHLANPSLMDFMKPKFAGAVGMSIAVFRFNAKQLVWSIPR
jgi:hypothetical protein